MRSENAWAPWFWRTRKKDPRSRILFLSFGQTAKRNRRSNPVWVSLAHHVLKLIAGGPRPRRRHHRVDRSFESGCGQRALLALRAAHYGSQSLALFFVRVLPKMLQGSNRGLMPGFALLFPLRVAGHGQRSRLRPQFAHDGGGGP